MSSSKYMNRTKFRRVLAQEIGLESLYGELRHRMRRSPPSHPQGMFRTWIYVTTWTLIARLSYMDRMVLSGRSSRIGFLINSVHDHTNLPFWEVWWITFQRQYLSPWYGWAVDIDAAVDILSAHRLGLAIFHCVAIILLTRWIAFVQYRLFAS